MTNDFIINKEVTSDNNLNNLTTVFPINKQVSPKDKFKSASLILICLGFFYLSAMIIYCIFRDDHSKFVFITTKEIIMHFGGLLIGFYFSRKN